MTAIGTALAFPFIVGFLAFVGHCAETWIARRWPVGRGGGR